MGIRIEHQPSGAAVGAAAYAAGVGKAKQRKSKYALDLWRDNRRLQARRQDMMVGMQFRKHLFDQGQAGLNERFGAQQEGIQKRFDADEAAEQRRFDENKQFQMEQDELRRQHDEDMLTDRGLQTGDLVVSEEGKKQIQTEVDDVIATMEKGGQFDDDEMAAERERLEAKRQKLRRAHAEKPKDVDELDDFNRRGRVIDPATGQYVKPKPGQKADFHQFGEEMRPAPLSNEQVQAAEKQEAAQEKYENELSEWKKDFDKETERFVPDKEGGLTAKDMDTARKEAMKSMELQGRQKPQPPDAGGQAGPPAEAVPELTVKGDEVEMPPEGADQQWSMTQDIYESSGTGLSRVFPEPTLLDQGAAAVGALGRGVQQAGTAVGERVWRRMKPSPAEEAEREKAAAKEGEMTQRRKDTKARRAAEHKRITAGARARAGLPPLISASGPEITLSPDGRHKWDGKKWVPVGGA